MFGKLVKYEFKATAKWYLILSSILLGLSILAGILGSNVVTSVSVSGGSSSQAVLGMLMVVLGAGYVGLTLTNYIVIIRRFYGSLFSREGYLTWTLPVGHHAILLSKLLVALLWSLYCFLMLAISIFLLFGIMGAMTGSDPFIVFSGLLNHFGASVLFQYILWIVVTTTSGILMFYISISLGQLFQNHRGIWSLFFGFVLWVGLSIIGSLFPVVTLQNLIGSVGYGASVDGVFNFIPAYLYEIVKILSMYFAVHYITKFKLNLQ